MPLIIISLKSSTGCFRETRGRRIYVNFSILRASDTLCTVFSNQNVLENIFVLALNVLIFKIVL